MTSETNPILVIDDEQNICKGCHLSLSEAGYAVTCRTTGRSGLKDALQDDFSVVLVDLRLPDLDGMDILKRLREEKPGSLVIVMTGYSTVQNAVEAMKLGAFDYLAKPFSDDELIIAVGKALETKRLQEENIFLRKQLFERFDFSNIVGENPEILQIFERIKKVAPMDSTVLLEGESGTGKELFAGAIHAHSRRAARQFVALDCSTLATGLLESELFGHVKGAFTGAVQDKRGIFAVADTGTLFLDEVSNLSPAIQGKLLRVMETREYKPVGASHSQQTDVRIIVATNRELTAMVADGSFREDLFYRLNVFPIRLPPLRQRRDDIPKLAYHFLRFFCRKAGKRIEGFSDEALAMLVANPWPGNVRQLKNAIERLVIMEDRRYLGMESLQNHLQTGRPVETDRPPETLEELRAYKKELLEKRFGENRKNVPHPGSQCLQRQHYPCGPKGGHAAVQLFRAHEKTRDFGPQHRRFRMNRTTGNWLNGAWHQT